MREINNIVIHCTYTPPGMDIGVEEIREWHVKENKWTDIGYHFVIRRDGSVEAGRPLERPGAHVKGHNSDSIGVAWVGGKSPRSKKTQDNRTREQDEAMVILIEDLQQKFPGAAVIGHRDFEGVKKDCPGFDVQQWYSEKCNTRKKAPEVPVQKERTIRRSTIFRLGLSIIWKLWRYHRSSRRQSGE